MAGLRWTNLTADERDEFLSNGGTGVLSFSTDRDEPPTSLPVSYGYFAADEAFYFHLSVPPGSAKSELVDEPVSFVTHAETDDGWRSVVATGSLEELANMSYDSVAVQGMWAIDIPTIDIFDRPREEIEFDDFRLELETVNYSALLAC